MCYCIGKDIFNSDKTPNLGMWIKSAWFPTESVLTSQQQNRGPPGWQFQKGPEALPASPAEEEFGAGSPLVPA